MLIDQGCLIIWIRSTNCVASYLFLSERAYKKCTRARRYDPPPWRALRRLNLNCAENWFAKNINAPKVALTFLTSSTAAAGTWRHEHRLTLVGKKAKFSRSQFFAATFCPRRSARVSSSMVFLLAGAPLRRAHIILCFMVFCAHIHIWNAHLTGEVKLQNLAYIYTKSKLIRTHVRYFSVSAFHTPHILAV